jgi:hypothetical protein
MTKEETCEPMWYAVLTIATALPGTLVSVLLLVDRYRKRRSDDGGK